MFITAVCTEVVSPTPPRTCFRIWYVRFALILKVRGLAQQCNSSSNRRRPSLLRRHRRRRHRTLNPRARSKGARRWITDRKDINYRSVAYCLDCCSVSCRASSFVRSFSGILIRVVAFAVVRPCFCEAVLTEQRWQRKQRRLHAYTPFLTDTLLFRSPDFHWSECVVTQQFWK